MGKYQAAEVEIFTLFQKVLLTTIRCCFIVHSFGKEV